MVECIEFAMNVQQMCRVGFLLRICREFVENLYRFAFEMNLLKKKLFQSHTAKLKRNIGKTVIRSMKFDLNRKVEK